jgi:hypothetical protein
MANLTQKREAFCLAYIETGNQSEAYRAAFDAENMKAETVHKRASELMANGEVKGRIAELQAQAVERALVSVQSLTEELEEARVLALQEGQPSAAVSASMGKAKLHGLLTEKVDHKSSDGSMTPKVVDYSKLSTHALKELASIKVADEPND